MIEFLNFLEQELILIKENPLLIGVLILFFIFATYTDIKSLKIYNKFNLIFFIVRIIFIFIPVYGIGFGLSHLFGGVVGFLALTVPAVILMHKMGGDIKFITILGLYIGIIPTILLIVISCILMLMYSFIKKIITKTDVKKVLVPFAPFFMMSFIIILIMAFCL